MPNDIMGDIGQILKRIYGNEKGSHAFDELYPFFNINVKEKKKTEDYFSESDIFLITYGDTIIGDGNNNNVPLDLFHEFAKKYLTEIFSYVHFLPFFPYSSDDGFSVIDFKKINPDLGSWENIQEIGKDFNLMFDLVLNHISAKNPWFLNYLQGKKGFEDLAIETDPSIDHSMVTRPRSLPLLTEFVKASGENVHVWTTFSADQIDLNYKSVDVLKLMVETLIDFVQKGARAIRLDAIAYLWKEKNTNCVHLDQTHDIVKLFRKILDLISPETLIITETNVPHEENISYFGNGRDEAQMVYNFTLPPLLLYTFIREDCSKLLKWAKGLDDLSPECTYFNFTASHDGIGVRPLEGILPETEIEKIVEVVKENGGDVSYKRNADGSQSPYELNITYIDALKKGNDEDDFYHSNRFIASQAIQLVLPGIPAIYIHSLLGSRNWKEGVLQTGAPRSINRQKLSYNALDSELKDKDSFRSEIFYPLMELIKIKKKQPAFHPNASFKILDFDSRVFIIKRFCRDQMIIALTNISSVQVNVALSGNVLSYMEDLITGEKVVTNSVVLKPYQYVWLNHK